MNTLGTAVVGHLNVSWGGAAAIVCASVTDDAHALILIAQLCVKGDRFQPQTALDVGQEWANSEELNSSVATVRHVPVVVQSHAEQHTLTKKTFTLFFQYHTWIH